MTDSAPPGNGDRRSEWEPDDGGAAAFGGRHRTLNQGGPQAGSYPRPPEPTRRAGMPLPGADAPTTVLPAVAPRRTTTIHVSDVALPVSIVLWAIGVSRTKATTLGPFGLPAQLPVVFYAGVALLVLSAVIELAVEHPSRWRMALHSIGLVVILYGTAPLVYPEGRYSWLYKTIGVVQYITAHGQLNSHIDIYQNWPGFFALAAWFGKVAGVGSPLAYAKWAQLVFELAALPLLYLIYDALPLSFRQRWMALLLYSAGNWIGQDYLSPQGLGTVLSLGIMAITMHWLYTGNRAPFVPRRRWLRRNRASEREQADNQAAVSMQEVREAYQTVRSDQGPPGIDGVTIAAFEQRLAQNLQKVCDQMRSGDYRPAPVRAVSVPNGGQAGISGVPTVSDRIAQAVVARRLKTRLLQMRRAQADGHADLPAGQQPGNWVIMLDTRAVSANLRHDLMLKVVAATTDQRWVVDYVRRSLNVPLQRPDGSLGANDVSLLAGSPLSPVLTELVLYYAFDTWMGHDFPDVRFQHRPDAVAVHCTSERQARSVQAAIGRRLDDVGLKLSPHSIRIVPGQHGGTGAGYGRAQSDLSAAAASGYRYSAAEPRRLRAKPSPDLLVPPRRRTAFLVTILFLYFVLVFTHELSPYIVAVQLGVLAAARPLRPRWLPLAMVAIAIGFLLPRLSFVEDQYGLLSSLGSFFSNVAPPSSSASSATASIPASQLLIQHCADGLSVTIWLLALVGAWRRRHSGRIVLALVVLTYSPVLVLFGQAYGNEGILRVYLFSLPWAAALAAAAVEPGTLSRKMVPRLRAATGGLDFSWVKPALRWLRAPVALSIVLALFFVAFFGDDAFDTFPKTEVNSVFSFLQTARPGPIYLAEANAPTEDTARYDIFPLNNIFGSMGGAPLVNQATPGIAKLIAENSTTYTQGREPAYVLIAPSMVPYNNAYAQAPPDSFKILQTSLARSGEWKLIVNSGGTMIYELPPAAGS
jgi:retron-type reverse transcriptase